TITFSEFLDYARKIPLVNRIPWNRDLYLRAEIRPMRIAHVSLERLRSFLKDVRWSINSRFQREFVFNVQAAEDSYRLLNCAEINLTGRFFDLVPTCSETHSRKTRIRANL